MEYTERIGHAYFFAKKYIISKGYCHEIDWQDSMNFCSLTQIRFLEEASWVILASGISDKVVQNKFPLIKKAMFEFRCPRLIVEHKEECFRSAFNNFKHTGKISAIICIAETLVNCSFEAVKENIICDGINYLRSLPYIGKITAYHLAKNIGLNVAKPDRHLVRISSALGFDTAEELCKQISDQLQEKISLVDLVLWRYATLDKHYLEKIHRIVNG
jgi:hypothetical protein